jgi:two-component system, OmpR family, sensor histidine kinase CpxA
MTARVHSLFLKIFLWFWATVIVTAIFLVAAFAILSGNGISQSHASLTETARQSGAMAVEEVELHGPPAAAAYLARLEDHTHLQACLFDPSGNVIAGSNCVALSEMISRVTAADTSEVSRWHGSTRIAVRLPGRNGAVYVYATSVPTGPPLSRVAIVRQWCIALLVSGFICYLLTRYLTTPILRLREASQHLAAGELSTRAASEMERRHDELGSLVRDFNTMADRIEELISRQRQLISDVSHELRSPLARLNVALDIGRQRKGNDPAFDQMEQDIESMNEMIGRLLSIARLDASTTPVAMTEVDLSELVSKIVRSAQFELQPRGNTVRLTVSGQYFVQANAELLHSAIENVMRNAVRYTEGERPIEVCLRSQEFAPSNFIRLAIRDHGSGVPESELLNIFQPFYRVAEDRDRLSGGTGLGLAIAERVVRIHGGTIHARNANPHGLEVEILLPQLSRMGESTLLP